MKKLTVLLGFGLCFPAFAADEIRDISECTRYLKLEEIFPEIKPWSVSSGGPALTARHIFPATFIDEVERNVGKVEFEVHPGKTMSFRAFTKERGTFATWTFTPSEESAETLVIDGLELVNPIPSQEKVFKLHLEQTHKGLPFSVFSAAKRQLFKLASQGGYTSLAAPHPANFGVYMLYRRIVGMEPATLSAARTAKMLDAAYLSGRKSYPDEFRSFDDAAKSFIYTEKASIAWARYRAGSQLPSDVQLLKNLETGKPLGLARAANLDYPEIKFWIAFIDTLDPTEPILQWHKLLKSDRVSLKMKIPAPLGTLRTGK